MDQFDVRLQDDELLGEVELTTELIAAANQVDGPLSAGEIDRILGVVPLPRQKSSPENGPALHDQPADSEVLRR